MENESGTVLVVGATGTMGAHVLTETRARGARVRVLVRRYREELAHLDVEQVIGDLEDASSVRRALTGVASAFYVSPHDPREVELATGFIHAARDLGVRIVFAGVHISTRSKKGRMQRRLMHRFAPHYRGKLEVGRRFERDAPGSVLLVPSSFFENDDLFLEDIATGSYPVPLRRMPRIAARDIGAVAARALLDPAFPRGTHALQGTAALSGRDCADVWSAVLHRKVAHTGDDAAAWHLAASRRLPPGQKGVDYEATYEALGRVAVRTDRRALGATRALLGRDPVSYPAWAAGRAATIPSASAVCTTGPS